LLNGGSERGQGGTIETPALPIEGHVDGAAAGELDDVPCGKLGL
jgi:hypothetical protein